jgi:molybdopterin converting factor small subunit
MEQSLSITISMYDRSRRAAVTLPAAVTVGELSAQCCERWKLPPAGFVLRNVGSNELLVEDETLWDSGVRDGSELQIFPMVEGGAALRTP